jgi:hypothetical protein
MQHAFHSIQKSRKTALVGSLLIAILLAALLGATPVSHAQTDDGCDTSEAVACIPLPSDTSPAAAGSSTAAAGAANVPAPGQAASAVVPCPAYGCCTGGAFPAADPSISAAPFTPSIPFSPVPPPGCCRPLLLPGIAAPANAPSIAVPLPPAPLPVNCSPIRSVYSTINLANAADVRALRTLSTQGLSDYWRQGALNQIQSQVAQLQLAGYYASTRLYSIQVQDSSFSSSSRSATVHTMEHWLYQQRSLDDGSVVLSQDEWVANEYDLNFLGNAWYITTNIATLTSAP